VHFDQHMRPTKTVDAEGDTTVWSYSAAGGVEMTVTTSDRQSLKVVDSPDGNKRTVERNGAPWITAQFDDGGRLANLSEFGHSLLTQEWRPDGQLARTESSAQGASLKYDGQGLLSSIILHPVKAGDQPAEWQQTKLDRKGPSILQPAQQVYLWEYTRRPVFRDWCISLLRAARRIRAKGLF